jgi:GcrA cell cycle regulator
MKNKRSTWAEDHLHIAKSLWREGRLATEIARVLLAPPFNRAGTTRNSVLGILERAGLLKERMTSEPAHPRILKERKPSKPFSPVSGLQSKPRSGTVSTTNLPDKARVKLGLEPVTGTEPIPAAKAGDVARVASVADLQSNQCRWPVGDPGAHGFGFCGAVASDGKPYCPDHAARAVDHKATIAANAEAARKTRAA